LCFIRGVGWGIGGSIGRWRGREEEII